MFLVDLHDFVRINVSRYDKPLWKFLCQKTSTKKLLCCHFNYVCTHQSAPGAFE